MPLHFVASGSDRHNRSTHDMSSQPQESETCTIDLSREQQWVVHHVLTTRADEAIDDSDTPPTWLLTLVETIESDEKTLTYHQARKLHDALKRYATADGTPDRDVEPATTVTSKLNTTLEAW